MLPDKDITRIKKEAEEKYPIDLNYNDIEKMSMVVGQEAYILGAISEAERSQPKDNWISVKDRLPELNEEYNVVWDLEDGENPVVTTMEYDVKEARFVDVLGEPTAKQKVTHWMPLPTPPINK